MSKAEQLMEALQGVSEKLHELKAKQIEQSDFQNLSMANFRYIEVIHKLGEPTFNELAKRLELSKPTVTVMVAKLIEMGLVSKSKSQDDRRSYQLSLTQKGTGVIDQYNIMHKVFAEQIVSRLKDGELETLVSLLKKI